MLRALATTAARRAGKVWDVLRSTEAPLAMRGSTLAMHATSYVAVRWLAPEQAARVVAFAAGRFAAFTTEEARIASGLLRAQGTCLTRAMAIASRVPGGEVAIGVPPPSGRWSAHAWVEIDGVALDAADVRGAVIARVGGRAGRTPIGAPTTPT